MTEVKKANWYDVILKSLNFKKIALAAYDGLKPQLLEKVKATESKWDDRAVEAVDYLINKFLREEEK